MMYTMIYTNEYAIISVDRKQVTCAHRHTPMLALARANQPCE